MMKETKCKDCATSDCHRESKIISFEIKEGIKLGVIDCEHYEERQVANG